MKTTTEAEFNLILYLCMCKLNNIYYDKWSSSQVHAITMEILLNYTSMYIYNKIYIHTHAYNMIWYQYMEINIKKYNQNAVRKELNKTINLGND